jgi:hypothetical protein
MPRINGIFNDLFRLLNDQLHHFLPGGFCQLSIPADQGFGEAVAMVHSVCCAAPNTNDAAVCSHGISFAAIESPV